MLRGTRKCEGKARNESLGGRNWDKSKRIETGSAGDANCHKAREASNLRGEIQEKYYEEPSREEKEHLAKKKTIPA